MPWVLGAITVTGVLAAAALYRRCLPMLLAPWGGAFPGMAEPSGWATGDRRGLPDGCS